MNEQEVRKIVAEELAKNFTSGSPKVAPHTHNSVDNLRVKEADIVPNTRYGITLQSLNTQSISQTEVITLGGVPNSSEITFNGFAANNAAGNPATQRAVMNGRALFGTGITPSSTTFGTVFNLSKGVRTNVVYASNSMFINATGPVYRVSQSSLYFLYTTDGSSDIATVTLNKALNGEITLTITLEPGWQLIGAIIIS